MALRPAGWSAARAIEAPRLASVDALRGVALLGVCWANLLIFSGIAFLSDAERRARFAGAADLLAFAVERALVENRFLGLFSFLFGISFWLFLDRATRRGAAAGALFTRRIAWLFVFGALHGWLLWCFDILRFYALWGALLPLGVRMPPRRLLVVALAAAVLVPALVAGAAALRPPPVATGADLDALALAAFAGGGYRDVLVANWRYDWHLTGSISQLAYQVAIAGRLLLGLCAARALDLGRLEAHRPLLRRVLARGALAGVLGAVAGSAIPQGGGLAVMAFLERGLTEAGYLGLTLAYAAAVALAWHTARGQRTLAWLAPAGQMALSCYLLQTAAGLWLFYGCTGGPALMGRVGPAAVAGIALTVYAAQVAGARAWMRRFRFGPAEWVWRSLTYGRLQPLRRPDAGPYGG